jgi:hypothetical protein
MTNAFQNNAFQNTAFQEETIVGIIATTEGLETTSITAEEIFIGSIQTTEGREESNVEGILSYRIHGGIRRQTETKKDDPLKKFKEQQMQEDEEIMIMISSILEVIETE